MAKIKIEGYPLGLPDFVPFYASGHLLLIFEDDSGNEFVVRGGPQRPDPGNYGNLVLERGSASEPLGVPIHKSDDLRVSRDSAGKPRLDNSGNMIPVTAAFRGTREIPLNGRDASDVWNLILQHADNIHDAGFRYSPFGLNSNGTVGNLLGLVDIDVNAILPDPAGSMLVSFYGRDVPFNFEFSIEGTDRDDVIRAPGGISNQTFTGGQGNDSLFGGGGNKDTAVFSDNFENYDYDISGEGDEAIITFAHVDGTQVDGIDTLIEFEFAEFADRTVSLPLEDDGSITTSLSGDFDLEFWDPNNQNLIDEEDFRGGFFAFDEGSFTVDAPVYEDSLYAPYESRVGHRINWVVPTEDPLISLGTLTYRNDTLENDFASDAYHGANFTLNLSDPVEGSFVSNFYILITNDRYGPEKIRIGGRPGSPKGLQLRDPNGRSLPIFLDYEGVREVGASEDTPLKYEFEVLDGATAQFELFGRLFTTEDFDPVDVDPLF